MIGEKLYRRLTEKGLLVTSEDGVQITVSPATLLTDKDRDQIRLNKAELLDFLRSDSKGAGQITLVGKSDKPAHKQGELARFMLGQEEIIATRYIPTQGQVYGGQFALDCETEVVTEHDVPRLALVSVSDGQTHYLVHPDNLGAFVLAHTDLPVVFHNAAFDFWVVHEHLVRHKQRKAAAVWMNLLRRRRLYDTMLLDMLVRLAEGTDNRPDIPPRNLGVVADEYRTTLERQIKKLNRKYPGLFKLDAAGKLKRTAKTGVPGKSNKALDDYLLQAVKGITAKTGEEIDVPRTSHGQVAKGFTDWESLRGDHPFLQQWFEYEKTAKLCQFFSNATEGERTGEVQAVAAGFQRSQLRRARGTGGELTRQLCPKNL